MNENRNHTFYKFFTNARLGLISDYFFNDKPSHLIKISFSFAAHFCFHEKSRHRKRLTARKWFDYAPAMTLFSGMGLFLFIPIVASVFPQKTDTFRLPHPLAPTIAQLTEAEEDELDALIDRFMLFDIGRLPGPEGLKAQKDFEALKSDAIPALLRGLARSARLDHDCPVTVIAKKLRTLLRSTTDRQLLAFARDEADAADLRKHRGVITALKVGITGQLAALDRAGTPPPPAYRDPRLANLTVEELRKKLAAKPSDPDWAHALLGELVQRNEPGVLEVLAMGASSTYPNVRVVGRKHLADWMAKRPSAQLASFLKHEQSEVRRAAAVRLLVSKDPAALAAIDLLTDPVPAVRQAVHAELVRQAKKDLQAPGETPESQSKAVNAWKSWWQAR